MLALLCRHIEAGETINFILAHSPILIGVGITVGQVRVKAKVFLIAYLLSRFLCYSVLFLML